MQHIFVFDYAKKISAFFTKSDLGEVYTVRTQPTFVAMKPSEAGEKGRKRKNQSPTPGKSQML